MIEVKDISDMKECTFSDISVGDIFIAGTTVRRGETSVLMKIEDGLSAAVNSGTDRLNCVELDTGKLYHCEDTIVVGVVDNPKLLLQQELEKKGEEE